LCPALGTAEIYTLNHNVVCDDCCCCYYCAVHVVDYVVVLYVVVDQYELTNISTYRIEY